MDNKFTFTDAKITRDAPKLRAKSGKAQFIIWDEKLAGFGGTVGATGTALFAQARNPAGKMLRRKIGKHGGKLTIKAARAKAASLIAEIEAGAEVAPTSDRGPSITLRDALDQFCKKASAASERDYRSRIENWLAGWLDISLAKITEDMIERRYNEMIDTGMIDNANKTIKRFSTVYRRVRRRAGLPADPTQFMRDEKLFIAPDKREFESRLMERDFAKIIAAIDAYENPVIAAFGRLLALTGARPLQLKTLKWDDVDFEEKTFTMRTGNKDNGLGGTSKKAWTLPMCREARNVFVAMQSFRMRFKDERRDYVFPARDRRKNATPHLDEYKTLSAAIRKALKWDFQIYDFRRWMASRAVSLMNGAEARHIQTHAAKDAHGGYESPPPSQLRGPLQKFEDDLVKLAKAS